MLVLPQLSSDPNPTPRPDPPSPSLPHCTNSINITWQLECIYTWLLPCGPPPMDGHRDTAGPSTIGPERGSARWESMTRPWAQWCNERLNMQVDMQCHGAMLEQLRLLVTHTAWRNAAPGQAVIKVKKCSTLNLINCPPVVSADNNNDSTTQSSDFIRNCFVSRYKIPNIYTCCLALVYIMFNWKSTGWWWLLVLTSLCSSLPSNIYPACFSAWWLQSQMSRTLRHSPASNTELKTTEM